MRNLVRNGRIQASPGLLSGALAKAIGVIEKRGVARPILLEFLARNLAQTKRGIGHFDVGIGDVVEHHPVVAFPVDNRRQRHQREIAQRHLERAGGEPEFGGRAADRLQARPVGRGVAELANPRKTDFATKVTADHAETRGAAIHLVDLLDVFDPPDALFPFPKKAALLREWIFAVDRLARRGVALVVDANLVVRRDFGREHLGRKIERHACFRFGLVLREPLLHQLPKFRIAAFQVANRFRFEGEQAAVSEGLDRRGAGRAV